MPADSRAAKLAEIISDDEITRVHGHANFGDQSPREVVNDGVRKYAVGYTSGHTQLCILLEHGLITKPRPGRYDASLTKKGKRYARVLFADAFARASPARGEGDAPVAWRFQFPGWGDRWELVKGDPTDSQMTSQKVEPLYTRPTPATPEGNVGAIVPPHCTGSSLSFEPGVLHVRKDGSGYIAIDEKHFALEDDRCDGPDGPDGSVHWITRLDASEMVALRDFLNGQRATPEGLREKVMQAVLLGGDAWAITDAILAALQPQAEGGEG